MSVPPIKIRGIRQVIPPGYVVGRVGLIDGDAQLISFNDLATRLSKQPALKVATTYDTLGFQAPGPFSAGQQFVLAPCTAATVFPGGKSSVATCAITPHGSLTAYLVYNLPAFLAGGAPAGTLAEIAFAAGAGIGTITYVNSLYTVVVGQILTLVMPATADPSWSTVLLQFIGNPA